MIYVLSPTIQSPNQNLVRYQCYQPKRAMSDVMYTWRQVVNKSVDFRDIFRICVTVGYDKPLKTGCPMGTHLENVVAHIQMVAPRYK